MGLMSKILGGRGSRSTEDYVELAAEDLEDASTEAAMQVHIAEIDDQKDVIAIKDAIYDGDLVVADLTGLRTDGPTVERITDELREVATHTEGDIVQRGDDQFIVAPKGIRISREKLTD